MILLAVIAAGCETSSPGSEETPLPPSPSPTPLPPNTTKDGHLTFTVLELRCGIAGVVGSHSEGQPEGEFCRTRLRVLNDDPEFHTYVSARQLLAYDGGEAKPDSFAMAVRRQVEEMKIGARNLVELEVWWDVPRNAKVGGIKVSGDRDPMGYMNSSPVPHVPGGALIRMNPTR